MYAWLHLSVLNVRYIQVVHARLVSIEHQRIVYHVSVIEKEPLLIYVTGMVSVNAM